MPLSITAKPKKQADLIMPTCFIAMPISTPDPSRYHGDGDHFQHVLDHLFIPAVKEAGMEPIPPLAKGADVIQAEIIKHLETADLVLCDISTLNANVFFELGIRTALNKPVCIVRDEQTPRIPFDTTIVNHHSYSSSLQPWVLQGEIEAVRQHLVASQSRSDGQNTLWKYFGLTMRAEPSPETNDVSAHLSLLSRQVEVLSSRLNSESPETEADTIQIDIRTKSEKDENVLDKISKAAIERGNKIVSFRVENGYVNLGFFAAPSVDLLSICNMYAKSNGYRDIKLVGRRSPIQKRFSLLYEDDLPF